MIVGLPACEEMDLVRDGASHLPGRARPILAQLDCLADALEEDRPGHRLEGHPIVRDLTRSGRLLQSLAADHLGADAQAVRAIFFNKSPNANWTLGWHQDRTIAVIERHELTGFGPWTVKAGILHVAPPPALLAGMLTMRIHLDPVPSDNAPLLIAPGSHRLGLIAEETISATVAKCGSVACYAERGDIWLYATPILHASDRAEAPASRRVLQIDFSASVLPSPLRWRGV